MRILVAEAVAAEGVAILRQHHEVDERIGLTKDDYRALLPDYDALVVRSQVQVDADLIEAGRRLVVIGRAGVGVDNVDLDAATRAGITVVNAPTGNTIAAAEHTLALLYVLARRVAAADASVRRGEWKRSQFTGVELRGRTLGIIGLGKIGQAIAKRARAMEMTVLAVDPYVSTDGAALHGVELVTLDALLERADAITVHVPLTRQTRGMIGAPEIARMKAGAFLLNVARGGILDEAAVADALRSGHLGGAGIDVFEREPPVGSPLLDAPHTVLTPHLGASTAEAQVLVAEEVAAQIIDVLAGRPARYAVNATALARARGISIVERKSSDADAYSSLLTLTGESDGTTTTIAGTVANGEARLTRLGEHQTDMAPSPVMLVTRHQDRPGTMGRIGLILGEADVNISAMHLARSAPRADALMILALDDDVPPAVANAIRAEEAVLDLWLIRLGTDR